MKRQENVLIGNGVKGGWMGGGTDIGLFVKRSAFFVIPGICLFNCQNTITALKENAR